MIRARRQLQLSSDARSHICAVPGGLCRAAARTTNVTIDKAELTRFGPDTGDGDCWIQGKLQEFK